MTDWKLQPGQTIRRTELHVVYGGRRQGGIAPSRVTANILIFSSEDGEQYGYQDSFAEDGCFHYTGEGQKGDQDIKQGNRALAEHRHAGRSVRLFSGSSGTVTYMGEMELDAANPYYFRNSTDIQGQTRKVIVFRLRAIGPVAASIRNFNIGRPQAHG